jgi:type III secretion protein Q
VIPLPRYRLDEIEAGNRIFRRRAPVPIDGTGLSFAVCPVDSSPPVLAPVDIEVEIDGRLAWLQVERSLVDGLVGTAFPESGGAALDDELTALLLEAALADMLARVERLAGRRIALRRIGAVGAPPSARPLGLRLQPADGRAMPQGSVIWLEPHGLRIVAALLERVPPAPAPAEDLPIEVSCRLGSTRLATAELRALRPADLIVVERHALGEETIELVVGGHLAIPATIAHGRAVISGEARRPMTDETDRGGEAGDVDSVPVVLAFELGRTQMALGELRALAPGYSFDLGRDLRAPVDILANGRKIGSGELIQIDERIGVRVNRLFET